MSTVAIIPAAGSSSRMGCDKLLLPWGETVILGALLESLRQGGVSRSLVVRSEANTALATWLESGDVESVVNEDPGRGMLSSIWTALGALAGAEVGLAPSVIVVCPGDLPAIQPQTVTAVVDCVNQGALLAVPSFEGRRGHPLALAASLSTEIGQLDLSVGLRQLLERHAADLVEVPVEDAGILRDLDTPEEYARATRWNGDE
jgi:molybdenum cofactor cytidylyltransferase